MFFGYIFLGLSLSTPVGSVNAAQLAVLLFAAAIQMNRSKKKETVHAQ
ncbi:hypothetical protein ACFCVS_16115 [Bacillus altitudinis]